MLKNLTLDDRNAIMRILENKAALCHAAGRAALDAGDQPQGLKSLYRAEAFLEAAELILPLLKLR